MRYLTVLLTLLLAGCATPMKTMSVYQRTGAIPVGRGTVDMNALQLTVTIGQATYSGPLVYQSIRVNNVLSGVLKGASGQLLCSLQFNRGMRDAVGTCVDSQNTAYDVLVK